MPSAPDIGVGDDASWDEDMDAQEMDWEAQDNKCPTLILRWVESISRGEGEANVSYEATEGEANNVPSEATEGDDNVPSEASEYNNSLGHVHL